MLKNLIMESAEMQTLQQRTAQAVNRWEKTGLLEGLNNIKKGNLAVLLENQARALKSLLFETTTTSTTAGFEAWSNVALPLVRRVFSNLIANEIVGVQPMTLPSGLVFYVDFQHGTTKPTGHATSSSPDLFTSGDSVYGNTSSSASGAAMNGYYGGWQYSFGQNYITASNVSGTSPSASTVLPTASWMDVEYEPSLSASIAAGALQKMTIGSGALAALDDSAVTAISLQDDHIHMVYRGYTSFNSTGGVEMIVSASVSGGNVAAALENFSGAQIDSVNYIRKTSQDWRGDFEAGQAQVGAIPQVNMVVTSKPITAQTRKLQAQWTPEIQQDMQAYHNMDTEAELTAILADLTALEIDREIIADLMGKAVASSYWSRTNGNVLRKDGTTVAGAGTFYGTQQDWYQTLIETINEVSHEIGQRTLRGRANWIVTSPSIMSILEATNTFRSDKVLEGTDNESAIGIQKTGTLNNRWKVYVDPLFPYNKILVGFKGASYLETGYVYCPYVPFLMTPTILDPDDYTPRKAIMTRYAKTSLRPEFYGLITVRDMRY